MNPMLADLSIALNYKRSVCVMDPFLAFSRYGIPLVKGLGEVMELWVAREHWHILDNTDYYMRQQKLMSTDQSQAVARMWPECQTLADWEKLRAETDPATLKLFWVGDGPGESMLPPHFGGSLVWRFEALASSLDRHLTSRDALFTSFRDAVALSVALPSAMILTQIDGSTESPPMICQSIKDWSFDYREVEDDEWLRLERDLLRQQLVGAGIAKLRWLGLRLAVVHVVAPFEVTLKQPPEIPSTLYENETIMLDEVSYTPSEADYWQGTTAFWYPL